jgi:hypothetical protein
MEKFFEKISKVKNAKLRNGKEYQWSANVYNPGTGEFTICGYWKDEKTWEFLYHNEDGIYLYDRSESDFDIVLEEPGQWVNVIKMKDGDTVCHPKIYDSFYEAASFQKKISMLYLSPDNNIESIHAKLLSSRLVTH